MKFIPLTQGKIAIVDDKDYDLVNQHKWRATNGGRLWYAVREGRTEGRKYSIYMHRLIANTPEGKYTDHINRNSLDNRRSNLRICTPSENAMNSCNKGGSSSFKGVHLHKQSGKWRAQITVGDKIKHLGSFGEELQAAMAYDRAALRFYGPFARINKGGDSYL